MDICTSAAAGSSLRKRLRNPPRFFSGVGSAGASGATHCSGRRAAGVGASGAVVLELDHGSTSACASRGVAVGAQAFAGASVAAGDGVIHEAVEDGGGECASQVSLGAGGGAGSAAGIVDDGDGAFAAGPGAKMPVSDASRSSIAGELGSGGGGGVSSCFGLSLKRSASSAWRSERISGAGARCGSAG